MVGWTLRIERYGPGSNPGQATALCIWAKHFIHIVPIFTHRCINRNTPSRFSSRIYEFFVVYFPIDIDECSASVPVCDVNANCQNSDGSYSCSCKAGFTGDGKTCAGKRQ